MMTWIRCIKRPAFFGKIPLSSAVGFILLLSGTIRNGERGMMNDELKTQHSSLSIHRSAFSPRVRENYGKLPLSFEANQNQFDDQMRFLARGSGYDLSLTATEAAVQLRIEDNKFGNSESPIPNSRTAALRMKLVEANPESQPAGLDQLPGRVNYIIGNDPSQWREVLPIVRTEKRFV